MRVTTPPRKVFQYKKADYETMRRELRFFQAEFEERATTKDIEHLWTTFKNKVHSHLWRVKRICVFEHSVMTNVNCAYPAIQRGQGSGFLSEGSSWLTACISEQRRFWWDCTDSQAHPNLCCSHRQKYQICLTGPIYLTTEGGVKLLQKLNPGKACGFNLLPVNESWKN